MGRLKQGGVTTNRLIHKLKLILIGYLKKYRINIDIFICYTNLQRL